MPFRFPTSIPKTLTEMWERLREFVRQLEPVILKNVAIGTTETAVAHGLGERPAWFGWDPPHCIAVVRQTRDPDQKCVYLRATNPCVIDLKFVRGGPFKASNGRHDLADWDPAGSALGDHKVATDATDEAASGADYLLAKHSNNGNVTFALDSTDGLRRVKGTVTHPTVPTPYPGPMTPVGTNDPGNDARWARGDHSHPSVNPVADGAYLHTAFIPGQSWTACATLFGGYIHPWDNGWTRTAPGVWRRDAVGSLTELAGGFFAGVTPVLGMRVLSTYSPTAPWRMYDGIYRVSNMGSETSHGEVTRVTDLDESSEFVPGKCVLLTGGAGYTNHLFRYNGPVSPVVDTDLLEWEDLGVIEPPTGDRWQALTAGQLVSEGASAAVLESTVVVTATDGEQGLSYQFATLPGTPGVAQIPAGVHTFHVTARAEGGDPGATTTIRCALARMPLVGSPTEYVSGSTTALGNTESVHVFQATLAAPVAVDPTDQILWLFYAQTDSVAPVAVHLVYSNAGHTTRVRTTLVMATPGTTYHPLLTGRDEPDQHPYSALEPVGLARVPFVGAALAAADSGGANGKLALGDSNRQLVSPAGFDLTQIQTPTVPSGASVEKELVFSAAVKLQHDVTPDAGYSALYVHRTGSIKNPLWFKYAYSVARLLYLPSLDRWKVMSWHDTT